MPFPGMRVEIRDYDVGPIKCPCPFAYSVKQLIISTANQCLSWYLPGLFHNVIYASSFKNVTEINLMLALKYHFFTSSHVNKPENTCRY